MIRCFESDVLYGGVQCCGSGQTLDPDLSLLWRTGRLRQADYHPLRPITMALSVTDSILSPKSGEPAGDEARLRYPCVRRTSMRIKSSVRSGIGPAITPAG